MAQTSFSTGNMVTIKSGNPDPPLYQVVRVDEVNMQARVQPMDETDFREPWWVRFECLHLVP